MSMCGVEVRNSDVGLVRSYKVRCMSMSWRIKKYANNCDNFSHVAVEHVQQQKLALRAPGKSASGRPPRHFFPPRAARKNVDSTRD